MDKKFYGWKLVAALWVIIFVNLAFTSYGAGVIAASMAKDLSLGRSILGLGFTAFALTQGFLAPVVAMAVNKLGARLTLTYGSLFLALACFVLAYATHQGWHYVVAFGVGVGVGVGFSSLIPAQACVAMWFSAKRGLALSLVMAATGVGGFVAAPLLNEIITATDGNWRAGWYLISIGALVSAAVAFFFVRNSPAELGQKADGDAELSAKTIASRAATAGRIFRSSVNWTVSDALRTRAMWLIALASIGFAMPVSVFLSHGVLHLKDIGHSPAAAALAVGTLALCSIIGKLGAGYLCDRMEPRFVWMGCLAATAAGIVVAATARSQMEIYAFALLLGIGYGASLICWPAMVANYFGPKSFPTMMGVQMPMNTVVSSSTPVIVGFMFDQSNSYSTSFMVIGALTLMTAILLLMATPPGANGLRIRANQASA